MYLQKFLQILITIFFHRAPLIVELGNADEDGGNVLVAQFDQQSSSWSEGDYKLVPHEVGSLLSEGFVCCDEGESFSPLMTKYMSWMRLFQSVT